MLFLQQLRGELQKLLARPRTWIGYGAFLIMEALILFVYKLERSQQHMRGIIERNGLEFGNYYSSLTITFTIMLLSMFLLGSIYFALVAGDIVAKENEDGNLRMVFSRPISRLRLLLVKYTAVSLYTFSFVFFVGITGYLMAVAAVGWQGGLFVMEPKMKVFAAYPEWWLLHYLAHEQLDLPHGTKHPMAKTHRVLRIAGRIQHHAFCHRLDILPVARLQDMKSVS
ncbi:MAG: ABC transporter permease [Verrucomicrobia bacterium]|nr:ABC transporter permease [Verrucomicrobiota bacterium]